MKNFIGAVLFVSVFVSVFAFGSGNVWAIYKIQTELQVSDGKPTFAKIFVKEGNWGSIRFGDTSLKMKLSQNDDESVLINAEITQYEGARGKVLSRPKIITLYGESSEISMKEDSGKNNLRLKLVVTKVDEMEEVSVRP